MSDDFQAMTAALDQFMAMMRDTFLPAVVTTEKTILGLGGSPDLAREFSMELGARLFNTARFGIITEGES
jgi:hypothetical protein